MNGLIGSYNPKTKGRNIKKAILLYVERLFYNFVNMNATNANILYRRFTGFTIAEQLKQAELITKVPIGLVCFGMK